MTRETLASLRLRAERAESALSVFKERVREAAVTHAENEGHCRPGINEVLSDLDLEQVTSEWAVYLTATFTRDVRINVDAADESDAMDTARTMVEEGLDIDDHRWQDGLDLTDVEARFATEE